MRHHPWSIAARIATEAKREREGKTIADALAAGDSVMVRRLVQGEVDEDGCIVYPEPRDLNLGPRGVA